MRYLIPFVLCAAAIAADLGNPQAMAILLPAQSAGAVTFSNTILATEIASLLAYWPCHSTNSATLTDLSGNSKDLTLSGGYQSVSGQEGDAVRFTGASGYASRTESVIGASPPDDFTILMLANAPRTLSTYRLLSFGRSTSANPFLNIAAGSSGASARGYARSDAAAQTLPHPGGIVLHDQWRMITWIRSQGTNWDFWVDDFLISHLEYTLGTTTLNRTAVGALIRNSVSGYMTGAVQHVAIWNTNLSNAQITNLYTASQLTPYLREGPFGFTFVGRGNDISFSENAQGVAYDGTNYYFTASDADSASIYKLTRSGDTYTTTTNRDVLPELPAGATQINGLDWFNGYLWIGANNFSTTPKKGWIMQYDASLALISTNFVGAIWCEGGAWKDVGSGDEFWAVGTDSPFAYRFPSTFASSNAYLLPIIEGETHLDGERGQYQGAQWFTAGGTNYLLTQTHAINPDTRTDVHRWTGTSFEPVQVIPSIGTDVGQGLHWETNGATMVFAERGGQSEGSMLPDQTIVRATALTP